MNYPLISEYIDAILNAEDNFATLTNLRPVLSDDGKPVMSSGNYAVVFKMENVETGKLHAIKCFTRYDENRSEAYRVIGDYLKHEDSDYLVSFKYLDKELFVDSTQTSCEDFPILLMDWVEGSPLDAYLDAHPESWRRRDLTNRFHKLVCWLLREPFAHGDLKPDNILVKEDGSLCLIDYDGMFVPAMYGQSARENGTPRYTAPMRTAEQFDEHIDDYAAIKILLVLKYIEDKNLYTFDEMISHDAEGFIHKFDSSICDPRIAPLLSAYILVYALGRIDDQIVTSLLANRDGYDYTIEQDLKKKANEGDVNSIYALGQLYKEGNFVPQDDGKGLKWFYIASKLGRVDAACGICTCLFSFDIPLHSSIYKELEKKGHAIAICRQGEKLLHSNPEQGVKKIRVALELGNLGSIYKLALCYENGEGLTQDDNKAVEWHRKAAKQGHAGSQYYLGTCYEKGRGVQQDYSKAVEWYREAAEQGHARAQCGLGSCYANGRGVQQDYNKAVEWYGTAADQGYAQAQYCLGVCYDLGRGVKQNYSKAVEWYQKAAEQGHADAQCNLGYCYGSGQGVKQDHNKAVEWYGKAADQGHAIAQYNFGVCYENGGGVKQDYSKAVEWFQKAAEQGDADAQFSLGYCYDSGCGIKQNYSKAVEWYQKSAEQGHAKALCNLGVCYENGRGVSMNKDFAIECYRKAVRQGNKAAKIYLNRLLDEGRPF